MADEYITYRLKNMEVRHFPELAIVELIADEGVDLSADDATEMLSFIDQLSPPVLGGLANRKNSYSMSFEAQRKFSHYKGVKAVAIVVYSRVGYVTAKMAFALFYKIGIFMDRDKAVNWLVDVTRK